MRSNQDGEPVHRVEYDDEADLSFVVIESTAAVSGVSTDAIAPINDVLDSEALCDLFRPRADGRMRSGGTVSFRFEGYRIEIDTTEREVLIYE